MPTRDSRVVRAPVAMTQVIRTSDPKFSRLPNGDVIVSHRELVQDVIGSVDFQVTKIPVNPGLSQFLVWLSQMAPLYESYKFEKLDYEFRTSSSTATTGVVMCAVDYDASDSAPVDKVQLASYKGFVRSSPWENFDQRSTRENLNKRQSFFVRTGALSDNEDIKLYDTGNLFLATQGQASALSVGELYADYRVRLMTPQLNNPSLGQAKSSFFQKTTTTSTTSSGSNAPLSISDGVVTANSGVITITALAPYQGLCNVFSQYSGSIGAPTLSGSATTGEPLGVLNSDGTLSLFDFEVSFKTGQTLIITLGGTVANAQVFWARFGQYNNALTA